MTRQPLRSPAYAVALGVLAIAALGFGATIRALKLTLTKLPVYAEFRCPSIPRETASWKAEPDGPPMDAETEKTLGTTNHVARWYAHKSAIDADKHPIRVQLHLAYYTGMIDTVPHVMDRCFIGGGMQLGGILGNLELPFDRSRWSRDDDVPDDLKSKIFKVRCSSGRYARLPRDPDQIRLRTMKFLNGRGELFGGYFFIANGGTTPLAENVRLLAFDLRSTYAYYLKVQFTSASVTSGEELAKYAASLLDEMFGEVMLCVPDWICVQSGTWTRFEDGPSPGGGDRTRPPPGK